METVTIGGKEVPVTELVAAYTNSGRAAELEQRLAAANSQIEQLAATQKAVERLQTDPGFAAEFASQLAEMHGLSAPSAPVQASEDEGDRIPQVQQPSQGFAAPRDAVLTAELQAVKDQIARLQAAGQLDSALAAISTSHPTLNGDEVLQEALKAGVGIEGLGLVADALAGRQLLAQESKRKENDNLVSRLVGGDVTDEALYNLGASVSVEEIRKPDDAFDYENASMMDLVVRAASSIPGE